jgi:hypothetical protein
LLHKAFSVTKSEPTYLHDNYPCQTTRAADHKLYPGHLNKSRPACYHGCMFHFGTPETVGDWIVHIAGGIVAGTLIWWMLRIYVL